MPHSTHEVLTRDEPLIVGSNRTFGFVVAGAFTVVALLNSWHGGQIWPWACGIAAVHLIIALLFPKALGPLNRTWQRFGAVLHKVMNPIVMAFLFYGAILPTGIGVRLLGKDLLRLKRRPSASSYWITREPRSITAETMKDQF
jgi:hypothetical protein